MRRLFESADCCSVGVEETSGPFWLLSTDRQSASRPSGRLHNRIRGGFGNRKSWSENGRLAVSEPIEYRDILEFPGYRVGNDGSVWSCWAVRRNSTNRWLEAYLSDHLRRLKPSPNEHGYLQVTLSRSGKQFSKLVHRLVLEAFVGPCPDGMQACHDPDPDPANCRLDNLRWGTPQENGEDRRRMNAMLRGPDAPPTAPYSPVTNQLSPIRLCEADEQALSAVMRALWLEQISDGIVQCIRLALNVIAELPDIAGQFKVDNSSVRHDGQQRVYRLRPHERAGFEHLRSVLGCENNAETMRLAVRIGEWVVSDPERMERFDCGCRWQMPAAIVSTT